MALASPPSATTSNSNSLPITGPSAVTAAGQVIPSEPLREALRAVLGEPSYRQRARALAEELRAEPPVDEAVPLLEQRA